MNYPTLTDGASWFTDFTKISAGFQFGQSLPYILSISNLIHKNKRRELSLRVLHVKMFHSKMFHFACAQKSPIFGIQKSPISDYTKSKIWLHNSRYAIIIHRSIRPRRIRLYRLIFPYIIFFLEFDSNLTPS